MTERLRIGPEERLFFVSDLHLCETRRETTAAFFRFLAVEARAATRLFILGDLFEYWIGDDDDRALADAVAGRLRACSAAGTDCLFMHGNRDFLLGEAYAGAAALRLLADPTLVDLGTERLLLMHGDTLCTDDLGYQAFRRQVRDPAWQADFLARSPAERRAIAEGARRQSEEAKQGKQDEIMDANEDAIAEALRAFDYPVLIHGHTHRVRHHRRLVDGRPCSRWVLPDWHDRAHYLEWRAGEARFIELPPPGGLADA